MKNAEAVIGLLLNGDIRSVIVPELQKTLVVLAGGEYGTTRPKVCDIFWDNVPGGAKSSIDQITVCARFVPAVIAAYPETIALFLQDTVAQILTRTAGRPDDRRSLVQGSVVGLLVSFAPRFSEAGSLPLIDYLNGQTVAIRGRLLHQLLFVDDVPELPKQIAGQLSNLAPKVVEALSWSQKNIEGQVPVGSAHGVLDLFMREVLNSFDEQALSAFGRQVYHELLKALFAEKSLGERARMLVGALPPLA